MCARFTSIQKEELVRIIQEVERNIKAQRQADAAGRNVVFPRADVPIIVPDGGRLQAEVLKWGYPVTWQKEPVYNTRTDTAMDRTNPRNMWLDSLENRRCVVPAYTFYEPHKTEKAISPKTGKEIKQQYTFLVPGQNIIFMAGIYDDGYFSIMTTAPNPWMEPIHKRMPVVLRQDEIDTWLHGDYPALFDRSGIALESEKVAA